VAGVSRLLNFLNVHFCGALKFMVADYIQHYTVNHVLV